METHALELLLGFVKRDLETALQALDGQSVLSDVILASLQVIICNKIPSSWGDRAWQGSLCMSLERWFQRLLGARDQLSVWHTKGVHPCPLDLSLMMYPESFLVCIKQIAAITYGVSVADIDVEVKYTTSRATDALIDGKPNLFLIHGLLLYGADWVVSDPNTTCIDESLFGMITKPSEVSCRRLYSHLPILLLTCVIKAELNMPDSPWITCPVYKSDHDQHQSILNCRFRLTGCDELSLASPYISLTYSE
jgi:hypothetical protein